MDIVEKPAMAKNARDSRGKFDQIADNRAGAQRGEAFVDLLELELPGDEVIEFELALQVELDETRHVDAEAIGAHEGALDLTLPEEVWAMQLDLGADRYHPNNGGRAARR